MRKIPHRTCVACRTGRAKRDLVRIVRAVSGAVVVDLTGKQSGRGAYLCRQRSCWEAGLRRGVLERALKQPVPVECRPALEAFAASLPEHLPDEVPPINNEHPVSQSDEDARLGGCLVPDQTLLEEGGKI